MTKRATILKPFKVVQMMVACMDVSHGFETYFHGYLHTLSHEYNGMEYNLMSLHSFIHILQWFLSCVSTVHAWCKPVHVRSDVTFTQIAIVFCILLAMGRNLLSDWGKGRS